MTSINKKMCRCACGHVHQINLREINMYKGLVTALWKVFRRCEERGTYRFEMKDVRHLLERNEYARFGDWVLFAGLVFKDGKARYGLNLPRCREFFAGTMKIPRSVFKNPITKEITQGKFVNIRSISGLTEFLDENMQYIAVYQDSEPSLFR